MNFVKIVSIPFREFRFVDSFYFLPKCLQLCAFQSLSGNSGLSTPVSRGLLRPNDCACFNPFQGIQVCRLYSATAQRCGEKKFQSLSGNSGLSTLYFKPPFANAYASFQSLSGNSGLSTGEEWYGIPGEHYVSIPFREFRFVDSLKTHILDQSLKSFNPFQGIQVCRPLKNKYVLAFCVMFQSLSGNSGLSTKRRSMSVCLSILCFNPFQGIQVCRPSDFIYSPLSLDFRFQSLSGNSGLSTVFNCVPHVGQRRLFQSLSGNSGLSTIDLGTKYRTGHKSFNPFQGIQVCRQTPPGLLSERSSLFQSLSGNSGLSTATSRNLYYSGYRNQNARCIC